MLTIVQSLVFLFRLIRHLRHFAHLGDRTHRLAIGSRRCPAILLSGLANRVHGDRRGQEDEPENRVETS